MADRVTGMEQLPQTADDDVRREIVGFIEAVSGPEIVGWAYDKASPGKPLAVTVTIDDEFTCSIVADVRRPDVLGAGHHHPNVGFHILVPKRFHDGLEHRVEFFSRDNERLALTDPKTKRTSHSWPFTVQEAVKRPFPKDTSGVDHTGKSIILHLDDISEDGVSGWAYDEATPLTPTVFTLYIDGEQVTDVRCDGARVDVRNSGHPSPLVGFSIPIPLRYFDDASHGVEFRSLDDRPLLIVSGEHRRTFTFPATTIIGQVDGLHDGALRGWALSHDRRSEHKQGGLQVLVTLQGQPIAQLLANQFRADLGESLKSDPNCGFTFVPPPEAFTGRTVELHFKVIPGGAELKNSPYLAVFPELDTYRKLRELLTSADTILTEMWSLRARIKDLLPSEQFNLHSYDSWARGYFHNLATLSLPPLSPDRRPEEPPLVSIICPTYQPRIRDFTAAVESVIAQTYTNWELIIVDDASGSEELLACVREFAGRDPRIRPTVKKKNGGISAATNTGLKAAKGRFVAFFDHDDQMVERAMEIMVNAALRTGAKVLYCDEDKVDDAGIYSEVNLKPDWNYRLLLSQNYVCHILFVERAHLKKAGPLRSEFDGAQDHDLILRLAEITRPAEIHHVSEILYHWRKTPFSTAGSGKAKDYTVAAGVRAVSSHLQRRRLKAEVTSPLGVTLYNTVWTLPQQPKVTIIIPYREHAGMTRACVEALWAVTDYANYEVVLMDNWSTTDEALDFATEMSRGHRTRVIRVEEPFNFSRINNIAVAATEGEFLLFLNNDVMVHEPRWLEQMVGEALAGPQVGIVGNKLLYPSGLVQHGGVILGVGGIADHAHRGLERDAPGYMGRAISAQDLSAVTAACMLCRRDAFNEVGGFDETSLWIAYNDVDLCLKIRRAGYRIVWTAGSIAEHRESLSRGSDFKPEHQTRFFRENQIMEERWREALAEDPHYSKHFSRRSGLFRDFASFHES